MYIKIFNEILVRLTLEVSGDAEIYLQVIF